jgi:hypothetical protein
MSEMKSTREMRDEGQAKYGTLSNGVGAFKVGQRVRTSRGDVGKIKEIEERPDGRLMYWLDIGGGHYATELESAP